MLAISVQRLTAFPPRRPPRLAFAMACGGVAWHAMGRLGPTRSRCHYGATTALVDGNGSGGLGGGMDKSAPPQCSWRPIVHGVFGSAEPTIWGWIRRDHDCPNVHDVARGTFRDQLRTVECQLQCVGMQPPPMPWRLQLVSGLDDAPGATSAWFGWGGVCRHTRAECPAKPSHTGARLAASYKEPRALSCVPLTAMPFIGNMAWNVARVPSACSEAAGRSMPTRVRGT